MGKKRRREQAAEDPEQVPAPSLRAPAAAEPADPSVEEGSDEDDDNLAADGSDDELAAQPRVSAQHPELAH